MNHQGARKGPNRDSRRRPAGIRELPRRAPRERLECAQPLRVSPAALLPGRGPAARGHPEVNSQGVTGAGKRGGRGPAGGPLRGRLRPPRRKQRPTAHSCTCALLTRARTVASHPRGRAPRRQLARTRLPPQCAPAGAPRGSPSSFAAPPRAPFTVLRELPRDFITAFVWRLLLLNSL